MLFYHFAFAERLICEPGFALWGQKPSLAGTDTKILG